MPCVSTDRSPVPDGVRPLKVGAVSALACWPPGVMRPFDHADAARFPSAPSFKCVRGPAASELNAAGGPFGETPRQKAVRMAGIVYLKLKGKVQGDIKGKSTKPISFARARSSARLISHQRHQAA